MRDQQRVVREEIMKKASEERDDELREEYDFSEGTRGKYADAFAEGSNVVVLDPDVAAAFPDSESVNKALRKVAGLPQDGDS